MVGLAHEFRAEHLNFKLASLRGGTEAARISDDQRERLGNELRAARRGTQCPRTLGVLDEPRRLRAAARCRGGGHRTDRRDRVLHGVRLRADPRRWHRPLLLQHRRRRRKPRGRSALPRSLERTRCGKCGARMRRGDYFPSCNQCGKVKPERKARSARRGKRTDASVSSRDYRTLMMRRHASAHDRVAGLTEFATSDCSYCIQEEGVTCRPPVRRRCRGNFLRFFASLAEPLGSEDDGRRALRVQGIHGDRSSLGSLDEDGSLGSACSPT